MKSRKLGQASRHRTGISSRHSGVRLGSRSAMLHISVQRYPSVHERASRGVTKNEQDQSSKDSGPTAAQSPASVFIGESAQADFQPDSGIVTPPERKPSLCARMYALSSRRADFRCPAGANNCHKASTTILVPARQDCGTGTRLARKHPPVPLDILGVNAHSETLLAKLTLLSDQLRILSKLLMPPRCRVGHQEDETAA